MSSKYLLPSKLTSYLRRLAMEYGHSGDRVLLEIVNGSRFLVIEETEYQQGWDPAAWGHDVRVFLPAEIMAKLRLAQEKKLREKLKEDLNTAAAAIQTEYFNAVGFELADEYDAQYQSATALSQRPQVSLEALTFWKPGHLRLFISHRDTHKAAAKAIAEALEPLGISAFVAHDTLEPMSTWRQEILNGLQSMEFMLACITDDFHQSAWTDQEVGFAIARDVPIVRLKLQSRDPDGFIGDVQAIRGSLADPVAAVDEIYKALCGRLKQGKRLQETMVAAFVNAPGYAEAKNRFDRLNEHVNELSSDEVVRITEAFRLNPSLYGATYLTSHYHRLTNFLEKCTGKRFSIEGRLIKKEAEPDDEIPF